MTKQEWTYRKPEFVWWQNPKFPKFTTSQRDVISMDDVRAGTKAVEDIYGKTVDWLTMSPNTAAALGAVVYFCDNCGHDNMVFPMALSLPKVHIDPSVPDYVVGLHSNPPKMGPWSMVLTAGEAHDDSSSG